MATTLRTRSWLIAVVACGVAGTVLALVCGTIAFFVLHFSCGGDGGASYAAAWPYGRLCASGAVEVWAAIIWVVPPVLVAAGTVAAVVRRRIEPLIVAGAIAIGLLATTAAVTLFTPYQCSQAQREAGADCVAT
ncbi:MAG: hypothetical protein AAF962_15520 [Actinomycetota bacterium]